MTPEILRTAGLSPFQDQLHYRLSAEGQRWGGSLARRVRRNETNAEIVSRLTAIKRIGRWTVEMLLIFNLGRLDVPPVYDLGVRRKGFLISRRNRKLPEPEALARHGSAGLRTGLQRRSTCGGQRIFWGEISCNRRNEHREKGAGAATSTLRTTRCYITWVTLWHVVTPVE